MAGKAKSAKIASQVKPKEAFRADTLIIGLTGSLGSGCTFIANGLKSILKNDCYIYRLSDHLRELAHERGLEDNTENLQNIGNELRASKGLSVLVEICLEKVKADGLNKGYFESDDTVIIIDGIRNDGEVRVLRQFTNFYLISVHADVKIREGRLVGRGKRFSCAESFKKADERDQHEDVSYGQQVKFCNDLSDVIIINDETYAKADTLKQSEFFINICNDYIYPMRSLRQRNLAHVRPPKIDETLMTIAYCTSKRSSCLNRKVGAVVAYFAKVNGQEDQAETNIQFQVISTGYNEVPLGTKPCIFSEQEKCYREYHQETHSQLYKYCPNCGKEIPDTIICGYCHKENQDRRRRCTECGTELLFDFHCPKCNEKIFSVYLPGGKAAPGKLLDLCRALHAEENAIIGLLNKGDHSKGEMVLYTTTFPCNLCANKIVAAGISRIVYAEPYPMPEAIKILASGNVKLKKFQGVKSTAYFRLYN